MKFKRTLRNSLMIGLLCLIFFCAHWLPYSLFKPKVKIPHTALQAKVAVHAVNFADLPAWPTVSVVESLDAFKVSCVILLKRQPNQSSGSEKIQLIAQDWNPACHAALALKSPSQQQAVQFFETWFQPVEFNNGHPVTGLFTGYYNPTFPGSLSRTTQYAVPIYGLPTNHIIAKLKKFDRKLPNRALVGRLQGKQLIPYYSRAEIDSGILTNAAPVLAWVKSKLDRLFIEVQGSGVIQLANGQFVSLNYAGENGAPYTSIVKILANQSKTAIEQVSWTWIRHYFKKHPDKITPTLNKNHSFVFFEASSPNKGTVGTHNISLTPGYSLAVDPKWVPFGTPLWLATKQPDPKTKACHPLNRLMIAQDTGGAIRGAVRGDVFWGNTSTAGMIASRMKHQGRYWLLLPKSKPLT